MTQLTLEDQSTIEATLIGTIRTDSDAEIVIYKNENGLYQALNDEITAYPLENEAFIDLAVEHLHHTVIENETLCKTVFDACITDQKKVGKNFPYFALNSNLPSHAQYGLIVVNDYGFWPKDAINPIYHCIAVTEIVELDFGYMYMTNDEQNIVITRYNKDIQWNEASDFLGAGMPVTNLKTLDSYAEKQQIIEAISKMNTDADLWV